MSEDEQKKEIDTADQNSDMMISEETYMTSGVHIGTRQKTADIKDFIYKVRNDGLYIIDVKKTDQRIKMVSKFLAKFDPSKILVVSVRQYGQKPIKKFAENTGMRVLDGRFRPGTLTNPNAQGFFEPDLLFVTDPLTDAQALHEARNLGIPIVGLCDTNNETKYLDLVIPTNNKGRRALALVYWLLTRAVMKEQGKIKNFDEFNLQIEDFEAEL
ncbi:MAG: 30S ribosomal protein S2 [Candidatus Thermoplasmatota archaeon]|jgi:small subunit ribosomal protein S2|nr:30S ribosomal protein S2 [Candidatus Thermoplasmatota archaeon]